MMTEGKNVVSASRSTTSSSLAPTLALISPICQWILLRFSSEGTAGMRTQIDH